MIKIDSLALQCQVPTSEVPARSQPLCPVCGGFLQPYGNDCRCSRCGFRICHGCEGIGGGDELLARQS